MTRLVKLTLPAVALLMLCTALPRPAHAQFAGDSGFEQMQQFAPMLEMMKKKMGKKRFAMLMRTMGPMMSKMMDSQGSGFGGGFGGFGGDMGGFDMSSMAGMMNFQDIAGMVQMFDGGGRIHHRHHKRVHHAHL
jgi:hypothetical protein